MSKYFAAVNVVDKHFGKEYYAVGYEAQPHKSASDAFVEATNMVADYAKRDPVVRADGFVYPTPSYRPTVLKEVVMVEDQ